MEKKKRSDANGIVSFGLILFSHFVIAENWTETITVIEVGNIEYVVRNSMASRLCTAPTKLAGSNRRTEKQNPCHWWRCQSFVLFTNADPRNSLDADVQRTVYGCIDVKLKYAGGRNGALLHAVVLFDLFLIFQMFLFYLQSNRRFAFHLHLVSSRS